jgi:hypothetical protein
MTAVRRRADNSREKVPIVRQTASLDTLAKHFGLLKEKIELGGQAVTIYHVQWAGETDRPAPSK